MFSINQNPSLPSININDKEYFFIEKENMVLAKSKSSCYTLMVKILTNVPNELSAPLEKIKWLIEKKNPVKIENGKMIFLSFCEPVQFFKKSAEKPVEENLINYLRLFNKGVSFHDNPLVKEKLANFLTSTESCRTFIISSPADLCAANLCLQELTKKELVSQARKKYPQFDYFILDSDLPDIWDKDDKKITKNKVINILKTLNFINSENQLQKINPEKKVNLISSFGEKQANKIIDVLFCIEFRSNNESIIQRCTNTKFLNPEYLSKMSDKKINYKEACLLLSHLFIADENKIQLIDPKTNMWNQLAFNRINRKEGQFQLELAVETLGSTPDEIWSNDSFPQEMKCFIVEKLKIFFPLIEFDKEFKDKFLQELDQISLKEFEFWFFGLKGWSDKWAKAIRDKKNIDSKYEIRFKEGFLKKMRADFQETKCEESPKELVFYAFDLARDEIYKKYKSNLKYEERVKQVEKSSKRIDFLDFGEEKLNDLFVENEHIIKLFLKWSASTIEIKNHDFNITWILDGVAVEDHIQLQKSGVVSRRVFFPDVKRSDLPYFDEDKKESIDKSLKSIKDEFGKSSQDLARLCLEIYHRGKVEADPKIKNFIVPLVILLLGKEPAMDTASHLPNYILLKCVENGLIEFEDALNLMPMIPQGAVAAKQFFSHIANLPLDWLAYDQCDKDYERIPPSFYLPNTNEFLGSASDWIQKYDEIIPLFVQLNVFNLKYNPSLFSEKKLNNLQNLLSRLYNDFVPREDLFQALAEESYLMDDEDLVGEFVINTLHELHPLYAI